MGLFRVTNLSVKESMYQRLESEEMSDRSAHESLIKGELGIQLLRKDHPLYLSDHAVLVPPAGCSLSVKWNNCQPE
jgi:hypothetical protein